MSHYNHSQSPYSPPAFNPPQYPPSHYGQGHPQYAQQPFGPGSFQHAPPYHPPHPGYPQPDPNKYAHYSEGYPPPKKHKISSVNPYQQTNGYPNVPQQPHYPPPPQQSYPPRPPYAPPAQAIPPPPPPPPPGWFPPPVPGWRGPVPPPPQQGPYYPPSYGPPQQPFVASHPTYGQDEASAAMYARNQHNQASHWNATHSLRPGQRRFTSLQWKRSDHQDPKDSKDDNTATSLKSASARGESTTPAVGRAEARSNSVTSQASPDTQSTKAGPTPPKPRAYGYDDSEDFEFETYYRDLDEEFDKKLSLGTVFWAPAEPVNRAIPSLYAEMDAKDKGALSSLDAKAPGGVSKYALATDAEEQSRSIRMFVEWEEIKADPVFVEFLDNGSTIPISQVIASRVKPSTMPNGMELDEEEGEIPKEYDILNDEVSKSLYARPDSREIHSQGAGLSYDDDLDNMDDDDEPYSPPPAPEKPITVKAPAQVATVVEPESSALPSSPKSRTEPEFVAQNVTNDESAKVALATPTNAAVAEQEKTPVPPQRPLSLPSKPQFSGLDHTLPPKPQISPFEKSSVSVESSSSFRSQEQEDILAKLGVTGEPKPVRGTHFGPAKNPPPPPPPLASVQDLRQPNGHYASLPSAPGVGSSMLSLAPPPPPPPVPPPPPPEEPLVTDNPHESDLWKSVLNSSRDSPKSETSQHTQAGSDFHEETEDEIPDAKEETLSNEAEQAAEKVKSPTPPNIGRGSLRSNKRSRDESEDLDDGLKRQKDEGTSRLRRRQPKVASAYSRRW